jgi:hypothetical protein
LAFQLNIDEFRARMSDGGILPTNRFTVIISTNQQLGPNFITSPNISTNFAQMANESQYRCINATLPGFILRTSDNNRMGLGILEKMPFSGQYTDIDLTFICDRFGAAYNFWYGWFNYIFAAVGKETGRVVDQMSPGTRNGKRDFYTMQYKNNYAALVDIGVLDTFGNVAASFQLLQAYPIAINDVPVAYEDQNNIIKLTVKMTFREWALDDGQTFLQNSQSQTITGS